MSQRIVSNALCAVLLGAGVALSPAAFAACKTCGTVTEVRTLTKEGEASGAGAVIGGLAGGVLGHQIGSGRGNTAATIAGAAGGAYAGHQIEKRRNEKTTYEVVVRMEHGGRRTFRYTQAPRFREGDKVKIVDHKLRRR